MDSVFSNSFQNVNSNHYRWPVILAILLHVLFFGLLFSHFSLDQATSYTQTTAIQANLVSSSALSAMMAKSSPTPTPSKTSPPPPKIKTPSNPIKPIPEKQPAPAVKIKPTPQTKPINKAPQVTKTTPAKTPKQKSLEESLLDTELNKTEKKTTQPKKINNTLEEQLMAEQLQTETKGTQASNSKPNQATAGAIDQYKALILQQIQQNWIIPEDVANLSCVLQVQLAPGGMVLHVRVLKSSGNTALDRSALAAVNKASPLPTPKDSATFSAFRNFTLTVKPEGK